MSDDKAIEIERRFTLEERPILSDLSKSGVSVKSITKLRPGSSNYERAVPILVLHAEKAYPRSVRMMIFSLLAHKNARGKVGKILLNQFIHEKDPLVRVAIGSAISATSGPDDIEEIQRILERSRDDESVIFLIEAIVRLAKQDAIPLLLTLIESPAPAIVGEAARGLGTLGELSARPSIEALTRHEKPGVRELARQSLRKLDRKISKSKRLGNLH